MKRFLLLFVLVLVIMSLSASPLYSKKLKIEGTWMGTTLIPSGEKLSITLALKKESKKQYSGTISDTSGMLQGIELKDIKFEKNKLTCYFDFTGTKLYIDLTAEKDYLTGIWLKEDDRSSGYFELKKEKK